MIAASTIAEFWRSDRGQCEVFLGLLRPVTIAIDTALAKRAGALLKETGGGGTLDALVVAVAERSAARQIYTSDVADIDRLICAAKLWNCDVVRV